MTHTRNTYTGIANGEDVGISETAVRERDEGFGAETIRHTDIHH